MREFLWVEDMAEACSFLMNHHDAPTSLEAHSEVRNTHLNIGTGSDVSIATLAEMIKAIVGFEGSFVFNAAKPDGTLRKLTDVSKINALGWKAKINLQEGLEKMYQWYVTQ
jgi:GDP-L-fucose synthase